MTSAPSPTWRPAARIWSRVNGASEAAAVRDVPAEFVKPVPTEQGAAVRAIQGIEDAMQQCEREGLLLHEIARLPWTKPAGRLDVRGYRHFAGPKGVAV